MPVFYFKKFSHLKNTAHFLSLSIFLITHFSLFFFYLTSVNSYLLFSQVSRLLWGSEGCSSSPSDGEASLAVHFLPHQLPAEAEPERQLRDAHWILGEMFFFSYSLIWCLKSTFLYFAEAAVRFLHSGCPYSILIACRRVSTVCPSSWSDSPLTTHCTHQR